MTNPPYSADHKVQLLSYLSSSSTTAAGDKEQEQGKRKGKSAHNQRPFLLLLPIYISSKSYWREFVSGGGADRPGTGGMDVYYVVPPDSYSYLHPEGTGKDKSPFFSCWFLGLFGLLREVQVRQCVTSPCLYREKDGLGGTSAGPRAVKAYTKVEELIARGYVTEKRANPKQRRKAKGITSTGVGAVSAAAVAPVGEGNQVKAAGDDMSQKKKKKRY